MRLDHFVVHVDNDEQALKALKQEIEPLGFPFEPTWGKGTNGFKASNIWIGDQYLELVWLKRPHGGGWKRDWVDLYNRGQRGICGLLLMTDELDRVRDDLARRGVPAIGPGRITYRALFGLLKKTLPWRLLYTPPIPGTNLQICFVELDPGVEQRVKRYMVPNSRDHGITGIEAATVRHNFSDEAWEYVTRLFPGADQAGAQETDAKMTYDMGTTRLSFAASEEPGLRVELKAATTGPERAGKGFRIADVQVVM